MIALALIGVIATIAIPKIIGASQNSAKMTATREVMAMVAGALDQYKANNVASASTYEPDLTPYMNYVKVESGNRIDERPGISGGYLCSGIAQCLRLHNGGILMFYNNFTFGGTTNLNALGFVYDPDGGYTGSDDSLKFYLYFNGRISTRQTMAPNTASSAVTLNPVAGADPTWFSL